LAAEYSIDTKTRTVRILMSGRVTAAEMYGYRRRMLLDPAFNPAFSLLVDARTATGFEMNGYSIKQFAEEQVLAGGARRAIVMSNSPDLALARMFQIYRELAGGMDRTELFEDLDKAILWLGLRGTYPWA